MNTLPPDPSQTSQVLSSLRETMLGLKHLFAQTESQEITPLQVQVLASLRIHPGISPTQLSQRLYLSSSSMAQLLQRLAESGWIRRAATETDLRATTLFLTDEGTAVLARYGELQDKEHIKAVFAELSSENITQLTYLLDKLNVALRKDTTNEKE